MKIKKIACLIMAASLCMVTACSKSEDKATTVAAENTAATGTITKETTTQATTEETTTQSANYTSIDVDLTQLSSTMIYSEVYNMMSEPDKYVGKVVKMTGDFSAFKSEDTGKTYFSCVISDATSCCAQGLEFTLAGSYNYPNDYPTVGNTITVTGVFETYYEGEYMYCQLKDAVMA